MLKQHLKLLKQRHQLLKIKHENISEGGFESARDYVMMNGNGDDFIVPLCVKEEKTVSCVKEMMKWKEDYTNFYAIQSPDKKMYGFIMTSQHLKLRQNS